MGKLPFIEEFQVVVGSKGKGCLLRVEGLNHDLSGLITPAAAPCHLGDHLEQTFRSPKVGQGKPYISEYNANQGYSGKVVSLGNHLGSNEDIALSVYHSVEYGPMGIFFSCGIPVHA